MLIPCAILRGWRLGVVRARWFRDVPNHLMLLRFQKVQGVVLTVLLLVHPLVLIGLLRDIVVVPVLASYFTTFLH